MNSPFMVVVHVRLDLRSKTYFQILQNTNSVLYFKNRNKENHFDCLKMRLESPQ